MEDLKTGLPFFHVPLFCKVLSLLPTFFTSFQPRPCLDFFNFGICDFLPLQGSRPLMIWLKGFIWSDQALKKRQKKSPAKD
ncbi:MAG: hypothetical protein HUJ55_01185 [Ileibacterium sp.]|nr:hypothetical protein [Ileibacterium sp.]